MKNKKGKGLLTQEMIKILHRASKNNFHFILSGDEAWFEYHYDTSHMRSEERRVGKECFKKC